MKVSICIFLSVIAAIVAQSPANAAPTDAYRLLSGNDLKTVCDGYGSEVDDTSLCIGFILGVARVAQQGCAPRNVTTQQLIDVVILYLRDHPAERHLQAESLVMEALYKAFGCGLRSVPLSKS